MLKFPGLLASTSLAMLLASCGSGSEEAPTPSAESSEAAMVDTGPFATAETAMKDRMDSAIGSSISDTWLVQMIEHHRGAIAMSKIVLELAPSNDVRSMAEATIAKQTKEIDELTKLRSSGAADPSSVAPYRPAGLEMHRAMMAASSPDISEAYLRKMLAHHRGAIALSDAVIANGSDPKVRAAAQKTKADQTREVAMIEAMLAGKPMATASVPPQPKASPSVPAPAPRPSASSPKPKPVPPKPAPAPAPSPMPSDHDMDNMPGMKM